MPRETKKLSAGIPSPSLSVIPDTAGRNHCSPKLESRSCKSATPAWRKSWLDFLTECSTAGKLVRQCGTSRSAVVWMLGRWCFSQVYLSGGGGGGR